MLLDLGPVVGSNVTFFREEVSCKICLEDLPKDIDRHVTEGKLDQLAAFFDTRFPYETETDRRDSVLGHLRLSGSAVLRNGSRAS